MLSSNLSLRKKYKTTLSDITYDGSPVVAFWGSLPTTIAPGIYIIYGQIRNNDNSSKSNAGTSTSVTVSVFTNNIKYNDGVAVETVANEVLNRIYRNPSFNLTLPESFFQIVTTTLQSDVTNDFSVQNQFVHVDRILIFNHLIHQNVS